MTVARRCWLKSKRKRTKKKEEDNEKTYREIEEEKKRRRRITVASSQESLVFICSCVSGLKSDKINCKREKQSKQLQAQEKVRLFTFHFFFFHFCLFFFLFLVECQVPFNCTERVRRVSTEKRERERGDKFTLNGKVNSSVSFAVGEENVSTRHERKSKKMKGKEKRNNAPPLKKLEDDVKM